jgi:hypothetical protein
MQRLFVRPILRTYNRYRFLDRTPEPDAGYDNNFMAALARAVGRLVPDPSDSKPQPYISGLIISDGVFRWVVRQEGHGWVARDEPFPALPPVTGKGTALPASKPRRRLGRPRTEASVTLEIQREYQVVQRSVRALHTDLQTQAKSRDSESRRLLKARALLDRHAAAASWIGDLEASDATIGATVTLRVTPESSVDLEFPWATFIRGQFPVVAFAERVVGARRSLSANRIHTIRFKKS